VIDNFSLIYIQVY